MPIVEESTVSIEPLAGPLDDISANLVEARLSATPLTAFPGKLPTTLEDAYAVQSASIRRWPDAVGGWKVGMVPADHRTALGAARLSGPIYQRSIIEITSGGTQPMPIFDGGFAAVEAEFVFRLARDIKPVERDYSHDDLIGLIDTLHIGAEIASSPMADVNRLGPCCVVCDFGNNAGLLVGPSIANWHNLPATSLTAEVSVDGNIVGEASAADIEGGLLQALRFLLGLCAGRGITLSAGTLVSCGALTGIHEVTVQSRSHVSFGRWGAFDVTFEAMPPLQEYAGSKA